MKKIITLIFLMSLTSSICFSEENLFSHIDYPELQVTPRATERLAQLAALEESGGLALHWTLLTSGGMTLLSGLKHYQTYRPSSSSDTDKANSDLAANAGILVGAGWMTWGGYLNYKRWAGTRVAEIKRIQAKDKRAELNRERLAEEFLEHTSRTMTTVDDLAMYTNLAANFFITCHATDSNRVYSILAMTTSMLPMLFPNIYNLSFEKHLEYKRKIYAPLATLTFTEKLDPMMALNWSF